MIKSRWIPSAIRVVTHTFQMRDYQVFCFDKFLVVF